MSRRNGPDEGGDDFNGIEIPEQGNGPGEDGERPANAAEWADLLDEPSDGTAADDDGGLPPPPEPDFDLIGEDDGEGTDSDAAPEDDDERWGELVGDNDDDDDSQGIAGERTPDLDDAWFLEGDTLEADPDSGDGPLDDRFDDIDEDDPGDLGDPDDDEDLPLDRAMARLGIEIPVELRDRPAATRLEVGAARELTFLGPRSGSVVAIAVHGGAPVAAGDGLYVTGADGMLHAVRERLPGFACSVCLVEGAILVGTGSAGAWRFDHPSARPAAINGWSAAGLGSDAGSGVSTSLEVFAGRSADAPLFGLTGEGQLFASRDRGDHWAGPLTDGPCLAATAEEDAGGLVALVERSREVCLVRGVPGRFGVDAITDRETASLLRAGAPRLATAGDTVVVLPAVPDAVPLLWSGGEGFVRLPAAAGATALALDGEDPSWIAAAFLDSERGHAEVRVSDDGGRSFQAALEIGPGSGSGPPAVTALAVDAGTTTRLYAVTGRGVYRITLRRRSREH